MKPWSFRAWLRYKLTGECPNAGDASAHPCPYCDAKHGPPIMIVEGISGTFYYHLAKRETPQRALCGKETMATSIPLESWGSRGHLLERYCKECEAHGPV